MKRTVAVALAALVAALTVGFSGIAPRLLSSAARPVAAIPPIEAAEMGNRSLLAATCDGDADELFYDDGVYENQIGGFSDQVQLGTVFTIPETDAPGDVVVTGVRVTISSGGGIADPNPFYVCVYDATFAGGPTGSPLAACEGPFDPPSFDTWYDIELTTPVAVGSSGDFAVALDQVLDFISLARDETTDVNRGWASVDNGGTWALNSVYSLPGNYLLRAVTCTEVGTTTTTVTTTTGASTTTTTGGSDDDTDDDTDDDADDDAADDDAADDDAADDDAADDDAADDDASDDDDTSDDDDSGLDDDVDADDDGGGGDDDDSGGCCG